MDVWVSECALALSVCVWVCVVRNWDHKIRHGCLSRACYMHQLNSMMWNIYLENSQWFALVIFFAKKKTTFSLGPLATDLATLCVCARCSKIVLVSCGWPIALQLTLRHLKWSVCLCVCFSVVFIWRIFRIQVLSLTESMPTPKMVGIDVHFVQEVKFLIACIRWRIQNDNDRLMRPKRGEKAILSNEKSESRSKSTHHCFSLEFDCCCFELFYGWKSQLQLRRRVYAHSKQELKPVVKSKWIDAPWMDTSCTLLLRMHLAIFGRMRAHSWSHNEYTEPSHET